MRGLERTIKVAFDRNTGKILEAADVFDNTKNAFDIRRQFHKEDLDLYCCECDQKLNISTSKYDRLHFKHQPLAGYCLLKDGNLTLEDTEQINRILIAKESQRHKDLKNKIGDRLKSVKGIDISTIAVDDKFIVRGNEKRRPDVYCKYFDKEIVFEIQLSDLSLKYILSRYEFYRKHQMYLIWILDNFDIHKQAQLQRDIKYLTKYENFFKLDEETDSFKLACNYKSSFLTHENKLLTKWRDESITLEQVKFDSEGYQIYYYNFGDNKIKLEQQQIFNERKAKQEKKSLDEAKKHEEVRNLAIEKLQRADSKTKAVIKTIKELKEKESDYFFQANNLILDMDSYELEVLNATLNLRSKDRTKDPALYHWVDTAKQANMPFVNFILNCMEIDLDVNESDASGRTIFQAIYQNKFIKKDVPVRGILKRGYILTPDDEAYYNHISEDTLEARNTWRLHKMSMQLTDKDLLVDIDKFSKLLFIIESAKHKEIIGFSYKSHEWIAFANNVVQHHSEYWDYVEIAFNVYKIWDMLIELDKKGTFKKKIQGLNLSKPKRKIDCDRVFRDLYPELAFHMDYPGNTNLQS